jgi:carboxyl-terminal processing protease
MTMIDRRAAVRGLAAGLVFPALSPAVQAKEPPRDVTLAQDFDEMWETLRDRYCFFGEKTTDWDKVRRVYRPRAIAAPSWNDFAHVLRAALGELYDPHTSVRSGPNGIPRMPPFDLLVQRSTAGLRVTNVAPDSGASAAGLVIGDVVTAVDGVPVGDAVEAAALTCLARPDPAADQFVIDAVVAGKRAMARHFTVAGKGEVALAIPQRDEPPTIAHRRLEGGIGWIAIRSFGDYMAASAFDAALAELRDAPALIIDVRGNGGGDTAVARPIMGRFIAARAPYALMRRRAGRGLSAPWTEWVEPRGPFTYDRPVVVLCDRWSASMAEGFPMGMRGLGRARIVGTPMMQLGAAVFPLRLDRTGFELQYSAEPVYDVQDGPRWKLQPDVLVSDGADILAAGLAEARRMAAAA